MSDTLTNIDCVLSEEGHFFEYNGKYFKVKPLLFHIIDMKKKGESSSLIAQHINDQYNFDVSEKDIDEIVINQSKIIKEKALENKSYIHWKITLIKKDWVNKISKSLLFLFQGKISVSIILLFTLLLNIYFILTVPAGLDFSGNWALVYILIFLSALFHEIGHSTASTHYKVDADKIGFGFFLLFPVFYSDVTKIWTLGKNKRIIVNISGMYFQLIFVNILIIFYYLFIGSLGDTLNKVIYINYLMIILTINPYLRNDGYWVLSDFFEIPNLTQEARLAPYNVYNRKLDKFNIKQNIVLISYSVGFYLLAIIFGYYLIISFQNEYSHFKEMILYKKNFWENLSENSGFYIKTIIKYLVLGTIIYNNGKRYVKRFI